MICENSELSLVHH